MLQLYPITLFYNLQPDDVYVRKNGSSSAQILVYRRFGVKYLHATKQTYSLLNPLGSKHQWKLTQNTMSYIQGNQNKPLPYMLMAVSNIGCNWFAQCPWGIWYMCKVWARYSYFFKNCDLLKITKNPDRARRGKPRHDKTRRGGIQTRRCPLVLKILYIHSVR